MATDGKIWGFSSRGWRVAGYVAAGNLVAVVAILVAIYAFDTDAAEGIASEAADPASEAAGPDETSAPEVAGEGTGGELAGPGAQGGGGGGTSNDQGRADATTEASFGNQGNVRPPE